MTRRWYFFLVLVLLQFLPPYASHGEIPREDMGSFIALVLSKAPAISWSSFYIPLKLLPVLVFVLSVVFGKRLFRLLAICVACHFFLFALAQNIAWTEEYGFAIITSNVLGLTLVALSWIYEALAGCTRPRLALRGINGIFLVFALFALWYPIDSSSFQLNFRVGFFSNPAGLFACMVTPLYLVLLLVAVPEVNRVTLRITGYIGAILGFWNILINFVLFPQSLFWNGVLHLPLFSIALYAVFVSFMPQKSSL